jgi:hypothetical protein
VRGPGARAMEAIKVGLLRRCRWICSSGMALIWTVDPSRWRPNQAYAAPIGRKKGLCEGGAAATIYNLITARNDSPCFRRFSASTTRLQGRPMLRRRSLIRGTHLFHSSGA